MTTASWLLHRAAGQWWPLHRYHGLDMHGFTFEDQALQSLLVELHPYLLEKHPVLQRKELLDVNFWPSSGHWGTATCMICSWIPGTGKDAKQSFDVQGVPHPFSIIWEVHTLNCCSQTSFSLTISAGSKGRYGNQWRYRTPLAVGLLHLGSLCQHCLCILPNTWPSAYRFI